MGMNFPAMPGERPSFSNAPAVEASAPIPPGKEPPKLESADEALESSVDGAALRKLPIPGTAAATLLKSSGLNRLFARLNRVPAPPVACAGVIESCLVNWPTNSGLAALVGKAA